MFLVVLELVALLFTSVVRPLSFKNARGFPVFVPVFVTTVVLDKVGVGGKAIAVGPWPYKPVARKDIKDKTKSL